MYYGDYYDMDAKKIGTDGLNDGKKYIVLDNSQARQIASTNASGGTTSRSNVSSAIQKPSTEQIKAGDLAYNFTENTGFESGFVGAKNGAASNIITQNRDGDVRLGSGYDQIANMKIRDTSLTQASFDPILIQKQLSQMEMEHLLIPHQTHQEI